MTRTAPVREPSSDEVRGDAGGELEDCVHSLVTRSRGAAASVRAPKPGRSATRDPKALLAKRGVPLANGVELQLYEWSAGLGGKRGGGIARPKDGTVEAHFGRLRMIEDIPPGWKAGGNRHTKGALLDVSIQDQVEEPARCLGPAVSGLEWVTSC
jgi:hypothetical protein